MIFSSFPIDHMSVALKLGCTLFLSNNKWPKANSYLELGIDFLKETLYFFIKPFGRAENTFGIMNI